MIRARLPRLRRAVDEIHDLNCDVPRCTVCGLRALHGPCEGHDPWEARWRGVEPGVMECRERGWFATLVRGKGWQPCGPEAAGATENLNR